MKRLLLSTGLAGTMFCSFHSGNIVIQHKAVKIRRTDTILLPETYTTRKFMSGITASGYDGTAIPGNIVKYDSASNAYELETMMAIIKGNKPAVAQKPGQDIIFSGTIPSDSRFNGSSFIDGIKAEKNQVIDLEIKDDMTYAVPDGQIDTAAIRSAINAIPAITRKNMFYIASATVTIITYKIHAAETSISKISSKIEKLTKPDTAKKGVSIKSNSKSKPPASPFSSSESKALTDKVISVQLIPVDNFAPAAVKK